MMLCVNVNSLKIIASAFSSVKIAVFFKDSLMQISIETIAGLERRMTVRLPEENVDGETQTRLKGQANKVRINGFRPGKIPMRILQERFGTQIRQEVINEIIKKSFAEAIDQESLRLASPPKITILEEEKDLAYDAIFELYPDIHLPSFEDITISQPTYDITEQDLDNMMQRLRDHGKTWKPVTRAAQSQDQLLIDFVGIIDGEKFDGGEGKNQEIIIGSKRMIDGFEEGLIGAQVETSRTLDLQFPSGYYTNELAGKPVQFKIDIKSISEPIYPDIDSDFIKAHGIEDGDLQRFRDEAKINMMQQAVRSIRTHMTNQVRTAMSANEDLTVPGELLRQEIESVRHEYSLMAMRNNGQQPNIGDDVIEKQALKRVRWGLVLSEIVQKNNLTIDKQRVDRKINELTEHYENPKEIAASIYENKNKLLGIQSTVMEEQVIDWLLERINVVEKPESFDAVLQLPYAN